MPGQQDMAAGMLSGSQKKTAFALRLNAERLIREDGLDKTGFLTLTVGDYFCHTHGKQIPEFKNHCPVCKRRNLFSEMTFHGIYNHDEANARINSIRKFLLTIFNRAIIVTERHKSKHLHFHLLGSLHSDIRTGINFGEIMGRVWDEASGKWKKIQRSYKSASPELRGLWELLRDKLPKYGFGRHELLPIRKTGEAVAAYISKYIEKNVCNRTAADRRKKLVRYLGWERCQLKPNEFEWDGVRARAWRAKTAQLFHLAGCALNEHEITPEKRIVEDCASSAGKIRPKCLDGSEIKRKFGARWAMTGTGIWCEVFTDDKLPFLDFTPAKMRQCQDLLSEKEYKYHKQLTENLNWYRGLDFNRALKLIQNVCAALPLPEYGKWTQEDEQYLIWSEEKFEVAADYFAAFDYTKN